MRVSRSRIPEGKQHGWTIVGEATLLSGTNGPSVHGTDDDLVNASQHLGAPCGQPCRTTEATWP